MPAETARSDAAPRTEFLKRLAAAGYEGVLVLQLETVERVLTPKRRELIDVIRTEDVASIRDLARRVDRDPSAVHKDLQKLFEIGIVDFEEDGSRKVPRIRPNTIMVEPIL